MDTNEHTASVLAEVAAERVRQDAKWGEQNHPSIRPPAEDLQPFSVAA
jgi:hypothetical protein